MGQGMTGGGGTVGGDGWPRAVREPVEVAAGSGHRTALARLRQRRLAMLLLPETPNASGVAGLRRLAKEEEKLSSCLKIRYNKSRPST